MARAKKKTSSDSNARLYFGPSFEGAWQHVILPWFKSVGLAACHSTSRVLVALPHPGRAQFLRARLLEENVPLLGIHFVSPPQLREMLLHDSDIKLPLREDLRLLLSIAAEQELAASSTDEEKIATKSIRRAPDHLLRTIDELKAGGWKFEQAGPPTFRKLVRRFEELIKVCEFTSLQEADRFALKRSRVGSITFGQLLVTGFDGGHWPLWPLLQAAVSASEQSVVILSDPRDEARDLDEAWFGTWEQAFGSAKSIPTPNVKVSAPRSSLAQQAQLDLFAEPMPRRTTFLLGRETTEEAQAIVALALQYAADPEEGKRIGILFPAAGPLARSVAALLEELKIPHYDGMGHFIAPTLEDLSWLAWLRLQESNRLFPLLNFLATLPDNDPLFASASREIMNDVLRRAFSQLLIDDLEILAEFCAHHFDHASAPAAAAALSEVQFLPPTATLPAFVANTLKIFETLKWKDRAAELQRLSAAWKDCVPPIFSRQNYLRWLREILGKPKRSRDSCGAHPYSLIHLLSIAEAEGEPWSHVILAGLNEGAWPPPTNESDFVRDSEIETLNAKIKILNQRAVRTGRQGEGQWSVSDGATLCLGAYERRQIALRQIANVVESTSSALAVTASLFTDSVPRRLANPSEFFTRLYFEAEGKALSQTILEALREHTSDWIAHSQLFPTAATAEKEIAQTRFAYDERRKEGPAGEFEFALREPPSHPISFSASETERLFKTPALIWMRSFLGVQADEQDTEQWSLAVGNWVHQWLSEIVDSQAPNSFGEIVVNPVARVAAAAQQFRDEIASLLGKSKRLAPDWWTSTWSNAAYIANCFVGHVAQAKGWPYAGTEWSLRNLPPIAVAGTDGLKLRGRIDLILAARAPESNSFEDTPLWVVDYKTGKRSSLRSSKWKSDEQIREGVRKQLLKGDGVQVALYALALHQLGATEVGISLLARGTDLAAPQLDLRAVIGHEEFWHELAGMQRNGIFGMRGLIRSEFGFTGDYPLATLAVDKDLLENKWELTHPGFSSAGANEEEG